MTTVGKNRLIALLIFISGALTCLATLYSFNKIHSPYPIPEPVVIPCPDKDSYVDSMEQINDNLNIQIRDLILGKAISDANFNTQKLILKHEIENLTDSSRLKWFKDFCTKHNINPALVRFDH